MFKGIKKIVRRMGQSIRKMKFIKRTLISCTLALRPYWAELSCRNPLLLGGFSRWFPHRPRPGRQPACRLQGRHRSLVANAKGGKGSKASAEQAEGQAVPQKEEPVKTTLEEESRTLGDEFAAVGADADDGDLPEEEFRD